jgi:tetraacyldisaccharide 4'-kinase
MALKTLLYNLATDKYKGTLAVLAKVVLLILSFIYGIFIRALMFFCSIGQVKLGCKVISVGNITLGGTGKTPLVEYIAKYLIGRGHKVAILTRGYKSRRCSMLDARYSDKITADEPAMLQQKLKGVPVIVDADRIKGARRAMRDFGADTVILDDGFQQWGIKKDLEIVTVDSVTPFGNRHMIPRGILREPLSSLGRAGVFILTKVDGSDKSEKLSSTLRELNPDAEIWESAHKPVGFYSIDQPAKLFATDFIKTKKVGVFSGIGDPQSFENMICALGAEIGKAFRFPDHHNYTKEDIDNIVQHCRESDIDTVITTEKDAVKLSAIRYPLSAIKLLVLRIGLEIKDEQGFRNRLLKLYSV